MQESTRDYFEALAKILLRSWIFSFVLLALWLGAFLVMGELIYKLHGPLFGITSHELDVMFYGGMGLLKIVVLLFFFIPWLSMRLVLKKAKG